LSTDRLLLRGFVGADVGHLFDLHNDPDARRFIDGGRARSHAEKEKRVPWDVCAGRLLGGGREGDRRVLRVVRPAPVGGLGPWRRRELGYRLKRPAWGLGLRYRRLSRPD
jgi:RimJ/RimL family protein N-acetyltransferase